MQKNVFWFQVAVNYTATVAVVECTANLESETLDFVDLLASVGVQQASQIAPIHKLCYQESVCRLVENKSELKK